MLVSPSSLQQSQRSIEPTWLHFPIHDHVAKSFGVNNGGAARVNDGHRAALT
jgi:hypothetical protein